MNATPTIPAQNTDAERAVLGATLVSDLALDSVIEEVRLEPADFGFERNIKIFAAIRHLHAASKPVDELTLCDELQRREQLDLVGGKNHISELAATVPAPGNARRYAQIVQRHALARKKRDIGLDLSNGGDPAEAVEQLNALRQRAAETAEPTSWQAVDLGEILAGGGIDPEPTIMPRSDGPRMIYDARTHQLSAEPEAGKTWYALSPSAELLAAGCSVVYVDFESSAPEIVGRLLALGVEPDRIRNQFVYLRPHEPLGDGSREELDRALAREPALVVIDGITEALTVHGLDLNDNADIARWLELLPRPAARRGAAVLMLDHVTKDKDSRGRFAIGAQHKLAGIDVAYALEVVEPFGRGKDGLVKVRVTKDRPGHVRRHAEGDQVALMRLWSDVASGAVTVTLDPPDSTDSGGDFRPTVLMERISHAIEANPGMTASEVRTLGGNGKALDAALKLLIAEKYIAVDVDGRAHRHKPIRPFRNEAEENR